MSTNQTTSLWVYEPESEEQYAAILVNGDADSLIIFEGREQPTQQQGELMADALNVHQSTGFTSSNLLQQRDELLATLQTIAAGKISPDAMKRLAKGAIGELPCHPEQQGSADWRAPTTYLLRFGDAMELLCAGKRPDDTMLKGWLAGTSEELQNFAVDHGPAWAQGIGLIGAALAAADQPTEGVDHEMTPNFADAA